MGRNLEYWNRIQELAKNQQDYYSIGFDYQIEVYGKNGFHPKEILMTKEETVGKFAIIIYEHANHSE